MMWTGTDLLVLAGAGALLALDQAAWPSLLLAQPLSAGALCGALLGHLEAGLAAGAVVQMLWMVVQPVGGSASPEVWLGGVAAAACAPPDVVLRGGAWLDDPRLAVPAVLAVAAAAGGRAALLGQRALQQRIVRDLPRQLGRADAGAIVRLQAGGLALHAARGAIGSLVVALGAPPLCRVLVGAGIEAPAGRFGLALGIVALVGVGSRRRRAWPLALGGIVGIVVALV